MFGKRILILVPHPDDEVVACATTLEHAKADGVEIFALYLTHGCISKDAVWPWQRKKYDAMVDRRQAEAKKAASYLGITPVGWNDRPARYLWQNMHAVCTEIQTAIQDYGIDQIWLPAYEGGNPDHDVLNAIGQRFKRQISVLEFAEYNFFAGKAQSNSFPEMNGTEQVINLSETEQKIKRAALALYKSEQSNLNYIELNRECFRPLADYDYFKPPHAGKLWYARFQWVPFKHPRVDFTNPMDVCKAITDFLGTES